jgi:hypothetical protein
MNIPFLLTDFGVSNISDVSLDVPPPKLNAVFIAHESRDQPIDLSNGTQHGSLRSLTGAGQN